MISSWDYISFASSRDNLEILQQLYSWCSEEERKVMLLRNQAGPFSRVFTQLALKGDMELLEQCYTWFVEQG